MHGPQNRVTRQGQGIDLSQHLRGLCQDLVRRLPELAHIDISRVAIGLSQARKPGPYGIHASLTPMRFEGGALAEKRRGRYYRSQQLVGDDGREMLYLLTFYLPRFMDVELREKLVTVVHELWHISPYFDGDIRRHSGRCYAHAGSRDKYDRAMGQLVDQWLCADPPKSLYRFLEHDFTGLQRRFGQVYGTQYMRPKLLPVSAAEAHRLNRSLMPRAARKQ
jgi:hypothetical protein